MTFGPHILRLLSLRRIDAVLQIAAEPVRDEDRRDIAREVESELVRLHAQARQTVVSSGAGQPVTAVQQTAAA